MTSSRVNHWEIALYSSFFKLVKDIRKKTRNALVVEQSLIACNGIEVIGGCIYEIKQIKQHKQQQTFNATLPYTQSLPRVYGCSSSSFLNLKPPFIRNNFQFLQKFKRILEKQPRLAFIEWITCIKIATTSWVLTFYPLFLSNLIYFNSSSGSFFGLQTLNGIFT